MEEQTTFDLGSYISERYPLVSADFLAQVVSLLGKYVTDEKSAAEAILAAPGIFSLMEQASTGLEPITNSTENASVDLKQRIAEELDKLEVSKDFYEKILENTPIINENDVETVVSDILKSWKKVLQSINNKKIARSIRPVNAQAETNPVSSAAQNYIKSMQRKNEGIGKLKG